MSIPRTTPMRPEQLERQINPDVMRRVKNQEG